MIKITDFWLKGFDSDWLQISVSASDWLEINAFKF